MLIARKAVEREAMTQDAVPPEAGTYDPAFYGRIREGSNASAAHVVPLIMDLLRPGSVLDLGCGTGSWLNAFGVEGVRDLLGLDFGEGTETALDIPRSAFRQVDLAAPLDLQRRFDMALSLEVAEHLPESAAATFVGNLTRHAPLVVFSAAIPGQRGRAHVNCQYPSYWAALFAKQGFVCRDLLRPRIWNAEGVELWYRQNMLVFATPDRAATLPDAPAGPLDLVHPEMLAGTISAMQARAKDQIKAAKARVWDKVRAQRS